VVIPALVRAFRDPSADVSAAALEAVEQLAPQAEDAIPGLIEALAQPAARKTAAEALAQFGDRAGDATAPLLQAIRDKDGEFRIVAAAALWRIARHPAAINALEKALGDSGTVSAAISDLADIGAEAQQAVPALRAIYNSTKDPHLRLEAAEALWYVDRSRDALRVLEDGLDDPALRVDAAEILWYATENPAALAALVEALLAPPGHDDDVEHAADSAADVLIRIGSDAKGVVPGLVDALRDHDKATRRRIRKVLAQVNADAVAEAQGGATPLPARKDYFFLASRKSGGLASVNSTTSSPVTVLMSWCKLSTLMPVTSWTIASITGRAVSIRWVRTCLSRSRPFSAGSDLTRCRSAAVSTPCRQTTRRSSNRCVWMT
jgi:hypothetical protein